jgi:hypothetical protein
MSLMTTAGTLDAGLVRIASIVTKAAVAFIVHQVYALGPAPGEAWRAILIFLAAG